MMMKSSHKNWPLCLVITPINRLVNKSCIIDMNGCQPRVNICNPCMLWLAEGGRWRTFIWNLVAFFIICGQIYLKTNITRRILSSENYMKQIDELGFLLTDLFIFYTHATLSFTFTKSALTMVKFKWSQIGFDSNPDVVKNVHRKRWISTCLFVYLNLHIAGETLLEFTRYKTEMMNFECGEGCRCLAGFFVTSLLSSLVMTLVLFHFIVDGSVLIESSFLHINSRIAEHVSIGMDIRELRYLRSAHSNTVDLLKVINHLIRYHILFGYTAFVLRSFTAVCRMIYMPGEGISFWISLAKLSRIPINFTAITYRAIRIHSVSCAAYEDLYKIAIASNDEKFQNEAKLFLERLGRRDIGFTFGDIFIISPNLVISVITLSVSFILTFPATN